MESKDHQSPKYPMRRSLMDQIDAFFQQDPFRGVLQSIDDFFENKSFFSAGFPVRLYETTDEWVIEAELPGVKRENIHIDLYDDYLRIAVENDMEMESQHSKKGTYTHERRIDRAERVIPLRYTIDRSRTRASFANGVLKIRGPKYPKTSNTLTIE
ncbi:Hsp20/alpha crystallin family protein [Sporolactobacillus sp. THM7-4]|nr:Hsp20/alpha crystallin family protein [Sporolactobacillus sp. THM7-4]